MGKPNLELIAKIRKLASPERTSVDIAELLGIQPRHARKILLKYDLPRPNCGAQQGARNHEFAGGRRITTSGYVKITPPDGHKTAKPRPGRNSTTILEHRYVMELRLDRYLLPEEIVDHIDGLTLHNHPDNLRLFGSNAEHLRETLAGKVPQWSDAGFENMQIWRHQDISDRLVDIYRQRKVNGAIRLRQILLTALTLGTDSSYLLGSYRHTTKAGIDMSSRSTIELALDDLSQKWGWHQTR